MQALFGRFLNIFRDARVLVILAQVTYLFFGIRGNFDVAWLDVALALVVAISTEYIFWKLFNKKVSLPLSAATTALGISMYFRSAYPALFALAAFIAIASKYVIRKPGGDHIFNPSNFGISSIVFLAPSLATVEFTQWGSSIWVYIPVAVVCFFIAWRAGVLPLSLSFIASYTFLLVILLPHVPDIFSPHHYGILGPSLVVFCTLMITDPKTIPKGTYARILQGIVAATMFFLFEFWGIRYSLFLAVLASASLNAIGEQFILRFASEDSVLRRIRNIPSFILVAVLGVVVFGFFVLPRPAQFSPLSISPDFILRGIESSSMVRPSGTPAYVESAFDAGGAHPETNGGAWGDYNGDGYDDLFVPELDPAGSRLYRNNGDGTFTDVTDTVGLPHISAHSGYFVDYDNDGRLDLFIVESARQGGVRVFHNTGSKLAETTDKLGLANMHIDTSGGAALSFADFNRDGYLDFVLVTSGNLIAYPNPTGTIAMLKSREDPFFRPTQRLICDTDTATQYLKQYGPPSGSSTLQTQLASNISRGACLFVTGPLNLLASRIWPGLFGTGRPTSMQVLIPGSAHLFAYEPASGTFVEHTDFAQQIRSLRIQTKDVTLYRGDTNFSSISGRYFQPLSFDYNGDGFQDIFLTVDMGASLLLQGDGHFGFRDVTAQEHLNVSGFGMGVAVADTRHTGLWDIAVTNVLGAFLYLQNPDHTYTLSPFTAGGIATGWGITFLDYNLDGWSDMFEANGDTRLADLNPDVQLTRAFFRADNLYRNDGGNFVNVSGLQLPADTFSGKGLAVSDYDNNGTPDVFVGNIDLVLPGQHNVLWTNQTKGAHWVKVSLHGARGVDNYFGIGATISVSAQGDTQRQVVTAGDSYYSQSSSRLVFGEGTYAGPVDISVLWPSGKKTSMHGVATDREITVTE